MTESKRIKELSIKVGELEKQVADLKERYMFSNTIIHNMVVANQSAWIEWKQGRGADAAMNWIQNGLIGPGHIPDTEQTPQEWCDSNSVEHHEQEAPH